MVRFYILLTIYHVFLATALTQQLTAGNVFSVQHLLLLVKFVFPRNLIYHFKHF